jgi:hypothetical protein
MISHPSASRAADPAKSPTRRIDAAQGHFAAQAHLAALRPFVARVAPIARPLRVAATFSPLTPTGLIVAVLLPVIYWWVGVPDDDRIVRVGCAAALVVLATCGGHVYLAALIVCLRKFEAGGRQFDLVVGVPHAVPRYAILPRWFPLVQVDEAWDFGPDIAIETTAASDNRTEIVTAHRRGEFQNLVRKYRITDVCGLFRCAVHRQTGAAAVIRSAACAPIAWSSQETEASDLDENAAGSPQGDLIESRRYERGDPLRLVLWKVYARSGEMLVRSPERTNAPRKKAMAYFVAGPADEFTARVAGGLLQSGSLGGCLWFQADGDGPPVTTPEEAVDRIVRSAHPGAAEIGSADDCRRLTSFLQSGADQGMTHCILFGPSSPGPWIERVAAAAATFPGTCRVVIGADAVADASDIVRRPSLFRRLLVSSDPPAVPRADWRTTARRLAEYGLRPVVFDPAAGVEVDAS